MANIRLATPFDAKHLPAVEASAGQAFSSVEKYQWLAEGEGQTEQDHLGFISAQLEWVVVNDCDEPIGFINAENHHHSLHICEVSVCQQWQGQGLGKKLIKQVLDAALARKITVVTLTTCRDVPWNAPYYQRLGFKILEINELTTELQAILQSEVDAGFAAEDRCAMAISLT
ncbi:GNAT family N-acetyltransferase [Providencia rettgeri]|uniref:GNAT family N-acetyltransferase n=1 Tax=Providencia TaxID=586 RepID=UPI001BD3D412|nr:GNAT family N-acetyltransferase [Providencia rettgeri]ELR5069610.1 GNAT family N-acetyltransferase [Providencia rettgeri]UPS61484.1 GNAT family N-acetyltransferase [Providencia rettgeri]